MNTDPLNNFPVILYDTKIGRTIPETFVRSSIDEYAGYKVFGVETEITGGFMEPTGHGQKGTGYAIFEDSPDTITTVNPGPYNIGIDYTLDPTGDQSTRAWYGGEVINAGLEGGYGNRVHVETDVTYEFDGKEYTVYTAYAHLDTIDVQVGNTITQGDNLGLTGGTGSGGATRYDVHVDLQTWIQLEDGRKVNVSPNLIQKQLAKKYAEQYGPPTLEVLEMQENLPPGTLELVIGEDLETPPPPHIEDVEDGFDEAEDQVRRRYYDPLIMDLDGDGIELTSLENSKVNFDIDGDGFREATGWVKSHDGFLVFDRNNDGYINDISELFGNQTTSGFTELQELDSNNDGQITASDANFAELRIWRDLDQDGYSDAQELFTLQEYSITRIDAVGNSVSINREGNLINETASFELADGTQRQVANVLFNIDQQNSFYDPYSTFNSQITITEQILSLPNLRGYGNLPDLYIAMAKDSDLQALVESFVENVISENISDARELTRSILLHWADADSSNLGSIDTFTQELKFLEKFVGRTWNNSNPSAAGVATIRNTFAQLESELETRLLAQAVESSVGYNTTAEKYEFSGDIDEVVEQFKQIATSSQASVSETLNFEATALAEFIQQEASDNNLVFNVFAVNEDATLEILASNVADANINLEGNNLSFSGINEAVNGTALINEAGNVEFTPAADFFGIAVFEYSVTDGTKTFTGLAQVNISPINDTPVANNDITVTDEDTSITILATELLTNDSDVDSDTLSIRHVYNTVNGTAIVNVDGNIEFTPDANFNGTAIFDYTVSDGIDDNTASVEITVNPVNDAPLVNNDTATGIDEDTSITILKSELLSNDSDLEGDSLSITDVSSDSGTAVLNAEGNIEFTPDANFNGTATFNYTVSDGIGSSTASVMLNVNPINDAPILTNPIPDITLTKNAEDSVLELADYFEDLENGDNLAYKLGASISSFQTNTGSNKFFDVFSIDNTKTLTLGYVDDVAGTAAITVKVTDSANESVETTFNVSVVNNIPVANNDTATTDENATLIISAAELLGNDRDDDTGDSLSIKRVNNSVNGTAVINEDGNVEFTPAANFNGTASFEYTVTDGMDDATGLVSIEVNPVNNAALAVNDIFTTDEDTSVTILAAELLSNDTGDNLSIIGVNNAVNGTAVINEDGNVEFTPAANFNGTASFDYTITDGTNNSTESVEVVVNAVNDSLVANNDTSSTNENTSITILATELLSNDSDVEQDILRITGVNNSINGTTIINAEGNIEFTPNAGFNGTASFDYTVTDGTNNSTASVEVAVNAANEAPTLTNPIPNLTVAKNAPNSVISLGDYFEDVEEGDNLAYSFGASSSIQGGTSGRFYDGFSFNSSASSLVLDYADDVIGTSTITVKATDSHNESIETNFTVSVVDSIDDTPNEATITAVDDAFDTNEDTSVTILATELLGNDLGGNLSLASVDNFVSGTAIVNEYGNIEFTPDANFSGAAGFEYTVTDGTQTSTGSVSVDVAAVNDAPVLVKPIHNFTVTQNATNSVIQLADYFEDVENGNNLGYSLGASSSIQGGTSGKFFDSFSLDRTKALTLDYADDVIGSSTITVKVTDSGNKFVETVFTVSVIDVSENGDTLLGGNGNDYLVGKQGNDTLNSGAGSDRLFGGAGEDSFVFNSPNEGADTIADFSVEDDTILFSATGFGGNLTAGVVSSEMLTVGTAATSNEHRFIYDAGSGDFSYDSDGTGDSEKIKLANLKPGLALTHNNLHIEL